MWNFSFIIPTLLVLMTILMFFFSLPRLPINRNRYFVQMILIETLTVIFDMASSYADNNYRVLPAGVVNVLNMAYFVTFFMRAFVMFKFTAGVLGVTIGASAAVKQILRGPYYVGVLASVCSLFNGMIFYIDKRGYHPGAFYNLLYFCGFFYVFLSFFAMTRHHRKLSGRRESYSIILYNMFILTGMVARLLFPTYLLLDTFVLMSVIVVYLAFENPEYYLELKSAVFNSRALREYIEEHTGRLSGKRCLGIVVHKYHDMRDIYGAHQTDVALNIIGRYILQLFPNGLTFYYRKGRFVLVGDRDADFEGISMTLAERFKKPWVSKEAEVFFDAGLAIIDLNNAVDSTDVILNTISKALAAADALDSSTPVIVNENELVRTENEMKVKRILENAIENNTVEVFLQPLIDAETGRVVGAESLCRLRDAKGGLIPPASFIEIAENNGRINELGEQVFEKTCRFIRESDLKRMGVEWINVNLSPVQFLRRDLAERFFAITRKYCISPEKIHLEITEQSMVDDAFLKQQIHAFGEKGFKFVLDDYGTGYSNLARLKKYPFINIKLDMSLVRDYYREPDQILPTMIQAFKQMGFGITSEGVEDDGMATVMKKIGCDYLQGYFYSKPIPTDEFINRYSYSQR